LCAYSGYHTLDPSHRECGTQPGTPFIYPCHIPLKRLAPTIGLPVTRNHA